MKLKEITRFLEEIAPLAYQEDYDNSGLLVGDPNADITAALISLDCTETVLDEAIRKGCNLIVSHHPIVFKGLKKFNGKNYVERVVMKAIKHDIALYAIHTNLDNVMHGVNRALGEKLGLTQLQILAPKTGILKKLITYVPQSHADAVRAALFAAGAGHIGDYDECSFNIDGFGTFKAGEGADPFVGKIGEQHRESETKIEIVYTYDIENQILEALFQAHPYEEVAHDLYVLSNAHPQIGSGMLGYLAQEQSELDFLKMVKAQLGVPVIRHTALKGKKVKKVAICGGSGSFLLPWAIRAGADLFITADYKYHEFFDADSQIVIADVGHYESEQFTQTLLFETITKKFPKFALHLTEQHTNPINY
ncbi:MAG: Nif3-like dinuclear metal center hexameric protein, partial [Sphingobacteriaceae bacterium]